MDIYIKGDKIRVTASNVIGKGGEADIYLLKTGDVAKIYKQPDHPDLISKEEKAGAKLRIKEHQTKLKLFPRGLAPNIIYPRDIIYDSSNSVIGYIMPYLDNMEVLRRYSERSYREQGVSM